MTLFLLVRHGQTEWNRIERFRGRVDLDLNATGLEQAQKTAIHIRNRWNPDRIFSSPLKRAFQTALAISEALCLPVEPSPALIDMDYGNWQGLTPEEAKLRWPDEIDSWFQRPERAAIPNGENLTEVQRRSISFVQSLADNHPDKTLVLVSHTVVNRLILLGILGAGVDHFWGLGQEPCAINVFEWREGRYTLRTLNDTGHLAS